MSDILRNCELWFAKLDPKRPNNKFNKKNPTWEVQIRTYDKAQKKEWEALNLPIKAIVPDEGQPYFRVNLRKKSIKVDGDASSPVRVVDGSLNDVDPNSIGNGSIGNVRIFQYTYPRPDGTEGIVSVLMGIQLTKHIVYVPKPRGDDFGEEDTEVIIPEDVEFDAEDDEVSVANIKI
jgi:hypothetical protein